jgi:hypothetical protein
MPDLDSPHCDVILFLISTAFVVHVAHPMPGPQSTSNLFLCCELKRKRTTMRLMRQRVFVTPIKSRIVGLLRDLSGALRRNQDAKRLTMEYNFHSLRDI